MTETVTPKPLTGAQAGIWYSQQLDPNNPTYNTAEYLEIKGGLNIQQFISAIQTSLSEANGLHVSFYEADGELLQRPHKQNVNVDHIDVTQEKDAELAAQSWMKKDLEHPVQLESDALFRTALIQLDKNHYYWFLRIHHIAADGYAFSLLMQRTVNLYSALLQDKPSPTPFHSYDDWIQADQDYVNSQTIEKDRKFWLDKFQDNPSIQSLKEPAKSMGYSVNRERGNVPAEQTTLLAKEYGGWTETIVAAFAVYLHKLKGIEDIVLGFPIMGRFGNASQYVPTTVMNTVPLRIIINEKLSLKELVSNVHFEIQKAKKNGGYRHEHLRRDLSKVGHYNRLFGPIVNVMPFHLHPKIEGCETELHRLSAGPTEDITAHFYTNYDSSLLVDIDGHPDIYKPHELKRHLQRLLDLIKQFANTGNGELIQHLSVLPREEYDQLMRIGTGPVHQWSSAFFLDDIEGWDNVSERAIVCGNHEMSYEELRKEVARYANFFVEQGIQEGSYVAIALPRSIDMVAIMLGTLKAGAAYLPLDPDYPAERLTYMVQDTKPTCLMTTTHCLWSKNLDTPTYFIDEQTFQKTLHDYSSKFVQHRVPKHCNPAYVIYTSGSTGRPKGVVVSRQALLNFLESMNTTFNLKPSDRFLAVTTIGFDISALELYLPLMNGSTLFIAEKEVVQDPKKLDSQVTSASISVMQATPTLWQTLVHYYPDSLKGLRVLVGGEALPESLKEKLLALQCEVTNLFGPTETTIWSTLKKVTTDEIGVNTVGLPISNTDIFVLDHHLQPMPAGVTGELYIGGDGLAIGYLNRPSLTADRFIANPFSTDGSRLYRTGDLATWDEKYGLIHKGRIDHQVKIRGFRIEIGEIENALTALSGIKQVAVQAIEVNDEQQLIGYIVQDDKYNAELWDEKLRTTLQLTLPDYMIPVQFVHLNELPLTENRKIDRKALPMPNVEHQESHLLPPRTDDEVMMSQLFKNALRLNNDISMNQNFFTLGGHSLKAVELSRSIQNHFGKAVSIADIFEFPTIEGLCQRLHDMNPITTPIVPTHNHKDIVPLTVEQERLWFLHQFEGPNSAYNIPFVVKMKEGELDEQLIRVALGDVITRHAMLGASFFEQNHKPVQQLQPGDDQPFITNIHLNDEDLETVLNDLSQYTFNLENDHPLRVFIIHGNESIQAVLFLFHHIILDGWSLSTFANDFSAAYNAHKRGTSASFDTPSIDYIDYMRWQKRWFSEHQQTLTDQLSFWKNELHNVPEEIQLPTDGNRDPSLKMSARYESVELDESSVARLETIAQEQGTSLFTVLFTAYSILLNKMGAGNDLPIGLPVTGRNHAQTDSLLGLFVKTLVVRTKPNEHARFIDVLAQVQERIQSAHKHQDVPFEQIVEAVNPTRVKGRNPLFQVMFAYQNLPDFSLSIDDVTVEETIYPTGHAKFDLSLELSEVHSSHGNKRVKGMFEYRRDLFHENTIQKLKTYFIRILETVCSTPAIKIDGIDVLNKREIAALTTSKTPNPVPVSDTIVDHFERQAKQHPQKCALSFEGKQLSYQDVNEKSNQLARCLREKGVGGNGFAAISLPRSLNMIVAILGTLKAGAAYVPIDPNYPADRKEYLVSDSRPSVIITNAETSINIFHSIDAETIVLDNENVQQELKSKSKTNLQPNERNTTLDPENPAYVIYTSGSTGKPKGVVITHANVVRLFRSTDQWFSFDHHDTWPLFHSYAFDFSVWEIWGALLHGGKLVIVPYETSRDPHSFRALLQDEDVTVLNQTPSAFYPLLEVDKGFQQPTLSSLRFIIFGGEALDLGKFAGWYDRYAPDQPCLINMYGITETTVHVSYVKLNENDLNQRGSIIGDSIPDLAIYILDDQLRPVPPGTTGEMYVTGSGLAKGYLGKPALTATRFIANPYAINERMYRTGDLAKWRSDGRIEYLGRIDHQIKLRGFRIELGEINHTLSRIPGIEQCATILREDHPGDQRLVTYIVHHQHDQNDEGLISYVKKEAKKVLPDYMLPSHYVSVDQLPLTTNGKLDQKALPKPVQKIAQTTSPRTPQEEVLCQLFEETLGIDQIGIYDSFFECGGHSLLAIQLIRKINHHFNDNLSIRSLFEAPEVAELAELLNSDHSQSELDVMLPLRKSGNSTPLFCIHPAGGLSWCYAGLIKSIDDVPIYGLQARGILHQDTIARSLDELVDDYVTHMRHTQPEGPYRLLGWSLGGNIAFEIACRLRTIGERVELLAILDSYPSHMLPFSEIPDELEAINALLAMGGYDIESIDDDNITLAKAISWLKNENSALASLDKDTLYRLKDTFINSIKLLHTHDLKRYDGDVLFFRSTVLPSWIEPISMSEWQSYITGDLKVHDVYCKHKDMCQPKPVKEIGEVVANHLTKMEKGRGHT
ncbi:amino acid adenylation domain-containing protein [Salicibibacter cibarius]|uniref:Amino acid adenylation domain-containing protein n=1 Tax=Salicibibacter cibarius TaxID=2743000 RepID=A0A7T6Z6A5_9BACI|nr:non-ribosomal peptide synthetase [Salicibibacter cibarius]QQK77679.1 amino acid adenylation domain-containing protein [Salicibibacter cibarius]